MDSLGFKIFVYDHRENLSTLNENTYAGQIIICPYEDIPGYIVDASGQYLVIATTGHKYDQMVLANMLDYDFKYLGMLGSKSKSKSIIRKLIDQGYSETRLQTVNTPIGLDICS